MRAAGVGLTLALVAGLAAPPAAAFYGYGAQIVSADFGRLEQGDDTTVFAAISANGRYVAIQTFSRNFFADDDPDPPGRYRTGGVFRFDLDTRALAKVADGDVFDESNGSFVRRGASNPSIGADGRYVAFATAERLVSADVNDHVDVYVRDMDLAAGDGGAYDLVSARDGGDAPATYGPPATPFPGSNPGADVSRGTAISADGRRVAFRTDAPSDLPASGSANVPSGQVFVRDRATSSTTLVTRTDPGGAPASGALGAALSADGTTVAWTGANAAAQTRFLTGEIADPSLPFYLWRRVADGPTAPTRRITGAVDPDDPACPPNGPVVADQTSTGPCYGPLTAPEGLQSSIAAQVPVLSADGRTVAFLASAGPRPNAATAAGLDLYVTDMTPGATRKQATTELTRDTVGNDPATSPPLDALAMASGGRYLAVGSGRTRFALPTLQLLGAPRVVPGPRELYVVDLQQRTLDRVTRAASGGDVDAEALSGVTISADGERVAFASFAGNLFFGDGNQHADAFVATRQPDPTVQPPPSGPGDGGPAGTVEVDPDRSGPRIRVTARSRRGGVVVLTIAVPAAGGVKATARARTGRPRKLHTLAAGTARARGRGRVQIRLRPVRRYRRELASRKTIPAHVLVSYVASRGGRRLSAARRVVFRQTVARR